MKALALLFAFAVVAPGAAAAECPPSDSLLRALRETTRASMIRLGGRTARGREPAPAPDPPRFLGYERLDTYLLSAPARDSIVGTFGAPASYQCPPTRVSADSAASTVAVGFELTSPRGTVLLVLREPGRRVELELTGRPAATAVLSPAGADAWRQALGVIVREASRQRAEASEPMRAGANPSFAAPTPSGEEIPDLPLETRVRVAPDYPQLARDAGVEGTVELQVVVGPDGLPTNIRVVKSIAMLDQAAVIAVGKWKFVPATREGRPITARMLVPVRFSLR